MNARYESPEFAELIKIQNTMTHVDIVTITGFMNHEQFIQHLERYREQAKAAK